MNEASIFFEGDIAVTPKEFKKDEKDLRVHNGLEEAEMKGLRMSRE